MSTSTSRTGHVFISHASADDGFVRELRCELEAYGIGVWVDSRNLRGGNKLAPEIEKAIAEARQVVAVLSQETVNSPWVRREIQSALKVEARRKEDGYRVVPLLLPGIQPRALGVWFDEEPVAVPIEVLGPGELQKVLSAILAALGERLPEDAEPAPRPKANPVEELVLILRDPKVVEGAVEGAAKPEAKKRRVTATAQLKYEPADPGARAVESKRFAFTAPLGPIEADDLRWYLERYFVWPVGVFQERAIAIEKKLPEWGKALFDAALGSAAAHDVLSAWQRAADGTERRFSVEVDSDLPEGSAKEAQIAASEAATELLALPWELLHDDRGWLFQGKHAARVRRRLPNRHAQPAQPTRLPIRILVVSPRPEEGDRCAYYDHRSSALPLVEAVERLGALARLTVLSPPTYAALEKALHDGDQGEPFDVVHFDGHGVYDRRTGLGALCFEDPNDRAKIEGRRMDLVGAEKLAALFRERRIPLVFLDACQSAKAEVDPSASVAAHLLGEGVASVVAMSYTVLVETARRFVEAFYGELALGSRVGRAMLIGQQALFDDTWRGKVMGAGDLHLQDWFVPVIFQEEQDPQLVTRLPAHSVQGA